MAKQTETKKPDVKAAAPQQAPSGKNQEVALTLQKERLPYHPLIEERFGVDKAGWRVIVETVWPGAITVEAVVMALSYCRARHLDPFKRPVHIVPVYNSKTKQYCETVWPGISELRTTAMRTGSYAGCDPCTFGEDIEETFFGEDKNKQERQVKVIFPEWAQITVYRMLQGQRVPFPGPRVYWKETYATQSFFSEVPNSMWETRPRGQLEKCAEAAALRRAYPEELGNEYAAEEMAGRVVDHGGSPVVPATARPRREDYIGTPAIEGEKSAPEKKQEPQAREPDGGGQVVEQTVAEMPQEHSDPEAVQTVTEPMPDFQDWLKDQYADLEKCQAQDEVEDIRARVLAELSDMEDEATAWKSACADRGGAIFKAQRRK